MEYSKTELIKYMKKAKAYGLNYNEIARKIHLKPTTIYKFVNGKGYLSMKNQLRVLDIVKDYIIHCEYVIRRLYDRD